MTCAVPLTELGYVGLEDGLMYGGPAWSVNGTIFEMWLSPL